MNARQVLIGWAMGTVLGLAPAWAGEGHDHGDGPAAASANGPQRLPDGSVFLPKAAQRQLGLRTMVSVAAELPRTVELNGRVLMDPNAGGLVQALVAGRIEPGPLARRCARVRCWRMCVPAPRPSSAPIKRRNWLNCEQHTHWPTSAWHG